MRILIASDSFKGSAASSEINEALSRGAAEACPEAKITCIPVADGGEGTVEALSAALGGREVRLPVHDALGNPVEAVAARLPDGAFLLETAAAAGLPQVPPALRNPLQTSSRGVGEMILGALDAGCRRIYLGWGGSATHDLGMGAMSALGLCYRDARGRTLPGCGADMARVDAIDLRRLDPRLQETELILVADVDNPLLGARGAAAVFAPHKGADPAMVRELEAGTASLAEKMTEVLGRDWTEVPGAGAAGGLGAALMAFCGGVRRQGIDAVLDMADFDARLAGTDLVITGEGRIDGQTAGGKVPLGVARRARRAGVPVLAVVGSIAGDVSALYQQGITSILPIVPGPVSLEEALAGVLPMARDAAFRGVRLAAAMRKA